MMPGTTVRPRRSITCVRGPGCVSPTDRKRPSLIESEDTMLFCASIVWILPLTKLMSASVCPGGSSVGLAAFAARVPTALLAAAAAAPWMNCRRVKRPPLSFPAMVFSSCLRDAYAS